MSLVSTRTHLRARSHFFLYEQAMSPNRPKFPQEFILERLQLILLNNHFFFDDKYYLQIKKTAMSTNVEQAFATLVSGLFEEKLYAETH